MPFPEYPGPGQRPEEDPQQRPAESGGGQQQGEPQPQRPPPYQGQYGEARPEGGWQPASNQQGQQAYWGQGHYAQWPYNQQFPQQSDPAGGRRPSAVTTGCVLAWVGSGLGILIGALFLVFQSSPDLVDPLLERMRQAGVTVDRDEMVALLQTVGIIMVLWCLAVLAAAVFAFRRHRWAAIALVAMAGCSLVVGVVNLLAGNPAGLVQAAWSVGSALLVFRGGKAWYDAVARR